MTTTTPTTPVGTTDSPARSSRGRAAVVAAVGVLAGAGIATAVVLGMGIGSAQQSTPAPAPAAHATAVVPHRAPAIPSSRVAPTAPSAAVETLQRELARLDYYEGSFTGTMNNQTVVAITYLQRDAGLPQTGTMNAATQQALATMLAQGNNQMGS
ncbi:peptidoglycan-binding domain-containing protein [Pseudonocardia charpentierae]|uniref:Peptidoglycan-binding domain-containing protein n=1 Tax=Pseudonocardia charpentierae TaxID=3075545 RepID=A0ABU2N9K1_9PSEU|nr:peptidoglycan-binding domain-containing protein [Pseudonocardia sp. DSM 45834]MDT0350158.1 peptidoglycan-binding domain-containing protein [Pseudonocardia sp. DSM 45834]